MMNIGGVVVSFAKNNITRTQKTDAKISVKNRLREAPYFYAGGPPAEEMSVIISFTSLNGQEELKKICRDQKPVSVATPDGLVWEAIVLNIDESWNGILPDGSATEKTYTISLRKTG